MRKLIVVVLAGLMLTGPLVQAQPPKPQFMFVQVTEDMRADASSLRLIGLAPQTVYFSDRPVRLAGHLTTADYLKKWTAAAGRDNFAKDPPNATLSVHEQGQKENSLVVVEISDPVVEEHDIVYRYRLIEESMSKAGGGASLFSDWIGPGGGVGAGFHGVGVGGRGVGWR